MLRDLTLVRVGYFTGGTHPFEIFIDNFKTLKVTKKVSGSFLGPSKTSAMAIGGGFQQYCDMPLCIYGIAYFIKQYCSGKTYKFEHFLVSSAASLNHKNEWCVKLRH